MQGYTDTIAREDNNWSFHHMCAYYLQLFCTRYGYCDGWSQY